MLRRAWLRRTGILATALVVASIGVPAGQPQPPGGSEFPLAPVWDALTTRPAWSLDRPAVPIQGRGGDVVGPHRVSADATRASGGNGGGGHKLPAADGPGVYKAPDRQTTKEWTTSRATKGFEASTSRLVQTETGADYELYRNTDGSYTRKVYSQPVNHRGADGVWRPIDTRLMQDADGRWRQAGNSVQVTFAGSKAAAPWRSGATAANDGAAAPIAGRPGIVDPALLQQP